MYKLNYGGINYVCVYDCVVFVWVVPCGVASEIYLKKKREKETEKK
jgi:hypothetical protein